MDPASEGLRIDEVLNAVQAPALRRLVAQLAITAITADAQVMQAGRLQLAHALARWRSNRWSLA